MSPISEFKDRIFHVHAKDTEVSQDKLKMYGVFNKQLNITREDSGYWVPKMPGLGHINWEKFIS